MPQYGQSRTVQPYGSVNRWLQSPLARSGRDLPLPRPVKGLILASEPLLSVSSFK
jgi:hypothetical protein